MIDRLSTWGESHSCGRGETLQCSSSVNKQQGALLEAAKGMRYWLWQLSPQGDGLSHKLIERSHMIGEFHLEPSRYIKPHRNEEFTEVPLHFPKSPQITCVIVTLCPLLPHLCTSLLETPGKGFACAHPGSITTTYCLFFFPFKAHHTCPVALLVRTLLKTWASLVCCYNIRWCDVVFSVWKVLQKNPEKAINDND